MARSDNEIRITPSVLDRLLDYEPDLSSESPKSRAKSLRDLRQSVRRDLEWLLNTRCFIETDDLEEAKNSVLTFGLPDFTAFNAKSATEQKRLAKELETAIRVFEPRFIDVRVTLEPISELERALKFRIDARIKVEPAPEPIIFDTVLQLGSGGFAVKEA